VDRLTARDGPQSALFAEIFDARYRYSGASFSYAIGAVLGGGFAPLIATYLQSPPAPRCRCRPTWWGWR
jgi:MFS family permease